MLLDALAEQRHVRLCHRLDEESAVQIHVARLAARFGYSRHACVDRLPNLTRYRLGVRRERKKPLLIAHERTIEIENVHSTNPTTNQQQNRRLRA
jgi:hypothetical protein